MDADLDTPCTVASCMAGEPLPEARSSAQRRILDGALMMTRCVA